MRGGEGALGCLAFALAFLPVVLVGWAIYELCKWAEKNPEEAAGAVAGILLLIASFIWLPPVAGAYLLIVLTRDVVVHNWSSASDMNKERRAVVCWLVLIPLVAIPGWAFLVDVVLSHIGMTTSVWGWWIPVYILASTIIFAGAYYTVYFKAPPRYQGVLHYHWPRFVAAEKSLLLDLGMSYIFQKTRLKLWWAKRWNNQEQKG